MLFPNVVCPGNWKAVGTRMLDLCCCCTLMV